MTTRAQALAAIVVAACSVDAPVGHELRRVLDVPPPSNVSALDVLFVIDSSPSLTSHRQAMVAAAGDALFTELKANLGTLPDLNIGVITSEYATSGLPAGCDDAHDGMLRTGRGTCTQVRGNFIRDYKNADQPRVTNYDGELTDAFACLADVAPSACEVAQPLAAARAALMTKPPLAGNREFLRDYAMLLVVFVTDRDDCSVDLPFFFSPGEFGSRPVQDRCFTAAARCDEDTTTAGDKHGCTAIEDGGLSSIDAFAHDLRALKSDPAMVMVAGVFVPPGGTITLASAGGDLVPGAACGTATGAPALRLAALAGQLSSRYAFASICDGSPAEQLRQITHTVAGVLARRPCLLGPVTASAPCRAYAEKGDQRAAIPACEYASPDQTGNCFYVEPEQQCADTESQLGAVTLAPPTSAHFVVECAAPDGL